MREAGRAILRGRESGDGGWTDELREGGTRRSAKSSSGRRTEVAKVVNARVGPVGSGLDLRHFASSLIEAGPRVLPLEELPDKLALRWVHRRQWSADGSGLASAPLRLGPLLVCREAAGRFAREQDARGDEETRRSWHDDVWRAPVSPTTVPWAHVAEKSPKTIRF